jgi:hypothetical protein
VDNVGIIVGGGNGVSEGATVGPAISVVLPPQAVRMAIIRIAKKKCLKRTGILQMVKNVRIIPIAGIINCLISRKQAEGEKTI